MTILADTHAHFYDGYDFECALRSALANLGVVAKAEEKPGPDYVLCLAERRDCHFFRRLAAGELALGAGITVAVSAEVARVTLNENDASALWIFPGRQVVTRERLEILAVTVADDIPENQPVAATVESVRAVGGIAVLPWGVGKWLFGRGRVIAELLERLQPIDLLIGDSSMRPVGWPEPLLMRYARSLGFRVVAGSDPLPFRGEERLIGRYGVAGPGVLDPRAPLASFRRWLAAGDGGEFRIFGKRCSIVDVFIRLLKAWRAQRSAMTMFC